MTPRNDPMATSPDHTLLPQCVAVRRLCRRRPHPESTGGARGLARPWSGSPHSGMERAAPPPPPACLPAPAPSARRAAATPRRRAGRRSPTRRAARLRRRRRCATRRGRAWRGEAPGRLKDSSGQAPRGDRVVPLVSQREPQRVQALLREGGQGEPAHAGSKRRRSPPPRWLRAVGRLRAGWRGGGRA